MAHHYQTRGSDLKQYVRNKFFYGKLLDVFHLELETDYLNGKRWLLNRLVTGCGVVCGLNIDLTPDKKAIVVEPGVAIDCCGREIIVAKKSRSEPLLTFPDYAQTTGEPQGPRSRRQSKERRDVCQEEYAHVVLCYRECEADPAPVMVSDCETALCAPGSIREQYEVRIVKGYAPKKKSAFPDVIEGGRISHNAIVDWVTRPCRHLPDDCCVPLANILLLDTGKEWEPAIDIYVRSIVFTNHLLYNLIRSLVRTEESE